MIKKPSQEQLQLNKTGFIAAVLFLLVFSGTLDAQPIRSRFDITCMQKEESIDLQALIRARFDRSYEAVPDLPVRFFLQSEDGEVELGNAITGENGMAVLTLDRSVIAPDTSGQVTFVARFEGNNDLSGSEGDLTVTLGYLTLEGVVIDSVHTIRAQVREGELPIGGEEVYFYINRLFMPLMLGSSTTDDDGMATIAIPDDLPGDAVGNLSFFARLEEDHYKYSNLEGTLIAEWGIPVSDVEIEMPRALWSPHPPLWMLITFNVLMIAVWGHYLVIVFGLIKVKKEGKELRDQTSS